MLPSSYVFPPPPAPTSSSSHTQLGSHGRPYRRETFPRVRRALSDQSALRGDPLLADPGDEADGESSTEDEDSDPTTTTTKYTRTRLNRLQTVHPIDQNFPAFPFSASAPPLSPPLGGPHSQRPRSLDLGLALSEAINLPMSPPPEVDVLFPRTPRSTLRTPLVDFARSKSMERLWHPEAVTRKILGQAKTSAFVEVSPESASCPSPSPSPLAGRRTGATSASPLNITSAGANSSAPCSPTHRHTSSSASESLLLEIARSPTRRQSSGPLDESTNRRGAASLGGLPLVSLGPVAGESRGGPVGGVNYDRRASLPGLGLTFGDPSPPRLRSPITDGMSSALRKRSQTAFHTMASESLSSLRSSIGQLGLTSLRRPATPPAPIAVPWEQVKAIRVMLHPGQESSTSANTFLLGLKALERGGTRPWDPRLPRSPGKSPATPTATSPLSAPPLSASPRPSPSGPLRVGGSPPPPISGTWPSVQTTLTDVNATPTVSIEYSNGASKTFAVDGLNPAQIMDQVLVAPRF